MIQRSQREINAQQAQEKNNRQGAITALMQFVILLEEGMMKVVYKKSSQSTTPPLIMSELVIDNVSVEIITEEKFVENFGSYDKTRLSHLQGQQLVEVLKNKNYVMNGKPAIGFQHPKFTVLSFGNKQVSVDDYGLYIAQFFHEYCKSFVKRGRENQFIILEKYSLIEFATSTIEKEFSRKVLELASYVDDVQYIPQIENTIQPVESTLLQTSYQCPSENTILTNETIPNIPLLSNNQYNQTCQYNQYNQNIQNVSTIQPMKIEPIQIVPLEAQYIQSNPMMLNPYILPPGYYMSFNGSCSFIIDNCGKFILSQNDQQYQQ